MKNSLFKRALAATAAIPLALTQCLTATSIAVTETDAIPAAEAEAADSSITLDSLLYIAPEDTESKWNGKIAGYLDSAVNAGNAQGTFDATVLFNSVASSAGKYSDVVKEILSKVGTVNYSIADNGDIVLTTEVGNIAEALSTDVSESLGKAAKELAEKYNAPELADIEFGQVDISGSVKINIGSGMLSTDTTVPAAFAFIDADGKSYGPGETIKYASDKLAELKKVAYDAIDNVAELDDAAAASAKADIDKVIAEYEKLINKAQSAFDKLMNANYGTSEKPYNFANVSELISAVNAKIKAKGYKRQIPGSGAAIMSNDKVLAVFNDAMAQFKDISPVAVDIQAAEIGEFIDELKGVNTYVSDGTAVLNATFDDAEAAKVQAYYEENVDDEEYVDSHKEITVSVDFSGLQTTGGSVDVKIKRIVETKPKTTTTTSTTTSSTTTTSDTTTTTTTTSTTTTTTSTTTTTTTTTTTYIAVVDSYVDVEADYGFYTDLDDEFSADQVSSAVLHVNYKTVAVDVDGNETVIDEFEGEKYDLKGSISFGDATPANTYSVDNTDFKYELNLFYNGEDIVDEYGNTVIASGAPIMTTEGQATATAYIGLKGDASLDNKVLANDASLVLTYYANMQSGGNVQLSDSALVDSPDSVYDDFAAFLCDVDTDIDASIAWKTGKDGRKLLASDAAGILSYYALTQKYEPGKETWDMALNGGDQG